MLKPIVRLLLRSGVTYKEAAELCKLTYVEVATEDYGLHGRPTNRSRVAIRTGLSRREVTRVRKLLDQEKLPDSGRINSASRVLTGWYTDPDFTDETGQPNKLSFDGDSESFSALCRKYAGDIAPITMLRELRMVGAVGEEETGELKVLKRYYMPAPTDPEAITRAGSVMQDLGITLNYNLARGDEQPSRFEGRATDTMVKASQVRKFREFLEEKAQALLEEADAWLSRHEVTADKPGSPKTVRLGLGIYQIQDDGK